MPFSPISALPSSAVTRSVESGPTPRSASTATTPNIAMLQTPDGHGRLELFEYIHPDAIETEPTPAQRDRGMHRVAFSVDDDIDEALEIAARHGYRPAARRGDLWGRVQAHLCPRPQRHPPDACRGAEEKPNPVARRSSSGARQGTAAIRNGEVWFQDMADFADGINDRAAGRRLTQSLQGRGAFRRCRTSPANTTPN